MEIMFLFESFNVQQLMIHSEGRRIEASAAESNDNFSGIELQDFRSSGDDQCYYFSLLQQSRF